MFTSLRTRLFVTFVLVVTSAVVLLAWVANWRTTAEFNQFIAQDIAAEEAAVAQLVQGEIARGGQTQLFLQEFGAAYGRQVNLADTTGTIIYSSSPDQIGLPLEYAFPTQDVTFLHAPIHVSSSFETMVTFTQAITAPLGMPLSATGGGVMSVEAMPPLPAGLTVHVVDEQVLNNGQNFLGAVNQNVILAALATIGLTAGVSLVLSQRIISPVEQLTVAARRLERGDLSQRVPIQGQDEISKLAHAFNAMADGLQNQEQLRRNMVSDIAHELRTPLTNLRGYIEAMQDGVVTPNLDTFDSLHEEVLLLGRLINDLQELSLAEAGQLRLYQQRVEMPTLLETAVSSFKLVAQEKEIALQTASQPTLPAVFADPERVAQIVRNLLHNALTHTPAGGEVALQLAQKGHEVEVAVYNSGEAIPPEHLPHLFDRFYRADKSRTRSTGGTGLGLAIVKALVEMQHGRVWVESRPGQGTTFFFTLPLA